MWVQKMPKNYVGEVHLIFRQTGTIEIKRIDHITEKVFRERWKAEAGIELPTSIGEDNGQSPTYGSVDGRTVRTD